MIDLHLSCLEDRSVDELRRIFNSTRLPILALNYNTKADWTPLGLTEEERIQSFFDAVDAGAAGVDMQSYTFDPASAKGFFGEDKYSFTEGNPEEIVTDPVIIEKQCDFIEKIHSKGAEVLLSCHPSIPMTSEQVVDLAHFLEERNPDIIKIVSKANTREDLEESIRTMLVLKKEVKTPVSYHAQGKAGVLSRIINPLLGGQIAFCIDRYTESSTLEQIDLKTARAMTDGLRKIYQE